VAAGYEHYEISNLCKPGFISRHNTKYWTGAAYYGFGCSAHSFDGASVNNGASVNRGRRWSNERDVGRYVQAVEQGKSPIVEQHSLTDVDLRAEALFLGMRMMRGVDV